MTGLTRISLALFVTYGVLAATAAGARAAENSDVPAVIEVAAHAGAAAVIQAPATITPASVAVEATAAPTLEAPAAVETVAAPPVESASSTESAPSAEPAPAAESAPAVAAPAVVMESLVPAAEAPAAERVALPAAAEPIKPTIDLSRYAAGTIVVETSERKLHLVLAHGETVTYPVGVGKAGKAWSGTAYIRSKHIAPPWSPPAAVKREKPWLPDYIPSGSPKNPMGAAAMTLSVDQYAIHGTNAPSSIGGFVSFGCIRMHNKDILDLFRRVHVGTRVVVLN